MTEPNPTTALDGEPLDYGSYLRIPQLLSLQQARSVPPHPEELHFIVVHEAIELWLKLALHDIERVIAALDGDRWAEATHLIGRVNRTLVGIAYQMGSLQTMPPWDLQEFRSYLGTASGSQSIQFRELELLGGLRQPGLAAAIEAEYHDDLPKPIARRLTGRTLAEAHADAAARLGIGDWADFYVDPGPNAAFFYLCEALVDFDERFARWRHEHVALVERAIGDDARGTGGTTIGYLRGTTKYRFFPALWELRNELVVRGGGELVGRPAPPAPG